MALEKIITNSENNAIKNGLINQECVDILNFRVNEEEKSARLYHNMYMFLNNKGYTGAGALWHKYGHEEEVHADWAKNYLLDLGIQPELREMPYLKPEFASFPEIIRLSYEHEVEITRQCKELAACAMKNADHMLYQLAAKFLSEQIEEIGKLQTWLDKLKAFGESPESLRLLDNEMAGLA